MTVDEETLKRRYREFLELAPLTMAIAGLPICQAPIHFSPDQMQVRAQTLIAAYRQAKQMVREAVSSP